jgi:AraC-like DNA-binding protein
MKPTAPKRKPAPTGAPDFFSPDVAKARRFFLNQSPPKRRRLAVVCGGLEHCTANYAIHRDTFPFFSIEYVARGHGELKLNGHHYELSPGRLFAYGPGISQHITSRPEGVMVKYFVDFAGFGAFGLLQTSGLLLGQMAQVFPSDALANLFDELIAGGLRGGDDGESLCTQLLNCLALKIASARAPLEDAESSAFTTYQQCRQFIEQHFLRLRTLEQIARECHVNNAYLCRLFKRYDQQTPYQYLLRLKMNHAAEHLQQAGSLIKHAAEATGFADPFHFSRVFTMIFGLSPSAFRRLRQRR